MRVRFRLVASAVLAAACAGCVTYEDAMDRMLIDFGAGSTPAPEGRKLAIFSVFVPNEDKRKIYSFSIADGEDVALKPIASTGTSAAPLVEFRRFELANNPPVADVYRNSGDVYDDFAQALSGEISDVFGGSTRVLVDFVVVPSNARLREKVESRVTAGEFSVRFYHPEEDAAWISRYRTDLKTLSHEVFHAYEGLLRSPLVGTVNQSGLSGALSEASASLFAKCVELRSSGLVSAYRDPIPTEDGLTIAITDEYLLGVLDGNDGGDDLSRAKRRVIGDILAWAIWLDVVGPRWEIRRAETGASKLETLCNKKYLGNPAALAGLVRAIASDGKDGPVFQLNSGSEAAGERR